MSKRHYPYLGEFDQWKQFNNAQVTIQCHRCLKQGRFKRHYRWEGTSKSVCNQCFSVVFHQELAHDFEKQCRNKAYCFEIQKSKGWQVGRDICSRCAESKNINVMFVCKDFKLCKSCYSMFQANKKNFVNRLQKADRNHELKINQEIAFNKFDHALNELFKEEGNENEDESHESVSNEILSLIRQIEDVSVLRMISNEAVTRIINIQDQANVCESDN